MRQLIFKDKDRTYTRISKTTAKKIFESGREILLCPVYLRPGEPWHPECAIQKSEYDFDEYISAFKIYTAKKEQLLCGLGADTRCTGNISKAT